MTTTLSNAQTRDLAPMSDEPTGMEELDASFFITPRWSIVQPNSKFDGAEDHVGEFRRNIDSAFCETLDAVILKANPNNAMFESAASKVPECFSTDGVNGSVYGSCKTCAFNRFFNRDLDERLRDNSQEKHCGVGGQTLVIVTRDDQSLAFVGVTGTSIRPVKLFQSTLKLQRKPFWAQPVRIETERQVNDKGRFYTLKIVPSADFSPEERAEWRKWFDLIQGLTLRDATPEEPNAEPDAEPRF